MKCKFIKICALAFCLIFAAAPMLAQPAFAASEPVYSAAFNGGRGALFANGTPIIISKIDDKTVASWAGGTQEIAPSVKIFGGGIAGTEFESAKIKMESGTVSGIYGGGFSTDAAKPATVGSTEIIINGGSVTATAYGGGLLYSRVSDARLTVNGGSVFYAVGGGAASAVIDGVAYNAGTETAPQDSGTVVLNAEVFINGGNASYVFGGGQGYSNTVKTSVSVSGGKLIYLTAGGSNGYTGSADVKLTGGETGVYQSVNRGTVNSASVITEGGIIGTFYIGSEMAADATGKINKAKIDIIGGETGIFNNGKNNNAPLILTKPAFDVAYAGDVILTNNVTGEATNIKVQVVLDKDRLTLFDGQTAAVGYKLVTVPAGHEPKFAAIAPRLCCADETVASVDGIKLTGENSGETVVTLTVGTQSGQLSVEVLRINVMLILSILAIIFFAVLFLALVRTRI